MQMFHKGQNKKSQIMEIKGKYLQPEQKKTQKMTSKILTVEQIAQEKEKINREQDILYEWGQFVHLDCLRAECILEKIIKPIEELQLLDMKSVDTIKMMFLLSTRCLNYISPIHYEYNKNKKSQIITQLNEIMDKLYKSIREKWNLYSRRLGPLEQKNVKIGDWLKNVLNEYKPQQQDIFFAGIEDMKEYIPNIWQKSRLVKKSVIQKRQAEPQGLSNYTKIQQIDFTERFIKANIDKLKESKVTSRVKNYLKGFADICLLQPKQMDQFKYVLEQMGQQSEGSQLKQ